MTVNNGSALIERPEGKRLGRPPKMTAPVTGEGVVSVAPKRGKPAALTGKIEIPSLSVQTFQIKIVGDSPLVTHKWSEKAKKMMLDKQMKIASGGKEAKDPFADFVESLYWLTPQPEDMTEATWDAKTKNAKFGFPAIGFKAAAVDACSFVDSVTKVQARGAFHVLGEYVEINGRPHQRDDMVRIAMGTADIRFRAEFPEWSATIRIRYNTKILSPAQIINLFNIAGFSIGIGEHRPAKDGGWGMFHVQTEQ